MRTAVARFIIDFRPPCHDGSTWTVRRHVEARRGETETTRREAGRVDVIGTHWPQTLHALHPMYAHAIGTETLLNRNPINDEQILVDGRRAG